jgi:WD40 repeat protein
LKLALVIVALSCIVTTGTVVAALHMQAATTEYGITAAAPSEPELGKREPRSDGFGDPLPRGAIARLGTSRLRHRGRGMGVLTFSPDGRTLYTCEWDGIFNAWDMRTGKNQRRYPLPIRDIGGFSALSPDTTLLAISSDPRTIDLRDSSTAKLLRQIQVPASSQVGRFAFAADGRTLACVDAGNNNEVYFWDPASGELLRRFALPQRMMVTRIEFPPDGRSLLLKTGDGWIHYFDLASAKELHKFYTGENNSPSYAFPPGTNTVATADGQDAAIKLWDLGTGKEKGRIRGEFHTIRALAYTPDGKTLVAADFTTVFFLDVATGRILHKVSGLPVRGAYQLRFSPDGKTLATTGNDTAIRLFDVATGTERFPDAGHHSWISGIAFSPNNQTLATASGDGSLRLWDSATGQLLHVGKNNFERWSNMGLDVLRYSPNGRTLIAGDGLGTISFWDAADARELRRFAIPPRPCQRSAKEIAFGLWLFLRTAPP